MSLTPFALVGGALASFGAAVLALVRRGGADSAAFPGNR